MDFKEFKNSIRTSTKGKQFKIRNSFGVYDCYKLIRKHGWYDIGKPVTEHEFYTIVRQVNELLREELLIGNVIKLPARMGALELRKHERGVKLVNGKLRIGYPIDWDSTLKLWYEDEEAKNNKFLIRFEDGFRYIIKYDKYNATYENKVFYQFIPHNRTKDKLKESIKQGKSDTLW